MIQIKRYQPGLKQEWNTFNGQAVNGTLLFYRDFMDYHAHRFDDFSLLFYYRNKLICLLPMNKTGNEVCSHGGLTYGGVIFKKNLKSFLLMAVFDNLWQYLRSEKVEKFTCKVMPSFLRQVPSEADLFALHQGQARVTSRTLSSVIPLTFNKQYSKSRRWRFNHISSELVVRQTNDYAGFMTILNALLSSKYQATATHSLSEIQYLASKFPNKIKLFAAYFQGQMVAGTLVFEHPQTIHVQYIATTVKGRELFALDLLMHTLISEYKHTMQYLSLGTSIKEEGPYQLNTSLLQNKESYGAQAVVLDVYQLTL